MLFGHNEDNCKEKHKTKKVWVFIQRKKNEELVKIEGQLA